MKPDLIFTQAKILTMDPARPRAEAIALAGGHILALGTRAEMEALAGPETRVIDAGGRSLLPGFVESHLHLVLGGSELAHLQVGGLQGAAALQDAVSAFAARHPEAPLLLAQGAGYDMLPHPMTRADLDALCPTRPLAFMAADHHTVWANTAALKAAGLLQGAPMPKGHEVVMGPEGLASGELREFEAFAPVIALGGEARLHLGIATGAEPAPWPSAAEMAVDRAKVLRGLQHCAAQGITAMVNMDGNRFTLELLDGLRRSGDLLARVKVPFHFKPHMALAELERAEAMRAAFNDEWLSSGFVKMFMDGVVDSRTAFMLNDYPGVPGHRGAALFDQDRFAEIAVEVDRRGLQMAVHAIGDGAVRRTIDGYAAARAVNGARDARHRIEHIELIDRSDVPRLARLGIIASLQPSHPPGAMDFPLEPTLKVIGHDRGGDAYLCQSLVAAGARLAFASDWPVTDVSVLRGLQAARTRPLYPGGRDERVSRLAALEAYTSGGAYAAHWEKITGRLVPGLAADLVLLSGDIESGPDAGIADLRVAATVCGGRVTYRGAAAPAGL